MISTECHISWKSSLNTAGWQNQHLNKADEDAERLSPGTWVPPEKSWLLRQARTSSHLWTLQVQYQHHKSPPMDPAPSQDKPASQHIQFLYGHFSITLPFIFTSPKRSFPSSFPDQFPASSSTCMHATCTALLTLLNLNL